LIPAPGRERFQHRKINMPFKFSVGQSVEYTPIGEKKAGLYKITRQMPLEEQAADLRYRIKSDEEVYERNVLECHLTSFNNGPATGYEIERTSIKPAPQLEMPKLEIE
jgi:hypothetical protein